MIMPSLSTIIRSFDLRDIGECPTCIRISFIAMVVTWIALIFSTTFYPDSTPLIAFMSTLFTLLWSIHILVRSIRMSRSSEPEDNSRRLVMRTFALAVMSAIAISAFPRQARADSACGGWSGNSGCNPCAWGCPGQC